MASHFLGGVKHLTLLESDAVLLGLYQKQSKSLKNLTDSGKKEENVEIKGETVSVEDNKGASL